mmetsp:Transcript_7295/g.12869  ORF Transcript_7295/g.12869 Transcript_7295/m.12869 type:complete len:230 (-) Transcript_7295:1465-2154(-)
MELRLGRLLRLQPCDGRPGAPQVPLQRRRRRLGPQQRAVLLGVKQPVLPLQLQAGLLPDFFQLLFVAVDPRRQLAPLAQHRIARFQISNFHLCSQKPRRHEDKVGIGDVNDHHQDHLESGAQVFLQEIQPAHVGDERGMQGDLLQRVEVPGDERARPALEHHKGEDHHQAGDPKGRGPELVGHHADSDDGDLAKEHHPLPPEELPPVPVVQEIEAALEVKFVEVFFVPP